MWERIKYGRVDHTKMIEVMKKYGALTNMHSASDYILILEKDCITYHNYKGVESFNKFT